MRKWVIFLDIDGVLNNMPIIHNKAPTVRSTIDHHDNQLSQPLIKLLNQLVIDIDADVVLSSAWRILYNVDEINVLLHRHGATFDVIDRTDSLPYERGTEISKWIRDNVEDRYGVEHHNFNEYIIIDDESDMLLCQREHFFQTDPHVGLTPTVCYKIKRFVNRFQIVGAT